MSNENPVQNSNPRKLSRSDWKRYIADWQASGMRKADFCSQHQLSYHSFGYYQKILSTQQPSKEKPAFIELKSAEQAPQIESIRATVKIALPTGIVLTVSEGIGSGCLKNILKAMVG